MSVNLNTTDGLGLHHGELEMLVRWYNAHAGPETRAKLMAELPVLYAKMFPSVKAETLADRVRARVEAVAAERLEHMAATLDAGQAEAEADG